MSADAFAALHTLFSSGKFELFVVVLSAIGIMLAGAALCTSLVMAAYHAFAAWRLRHRRPRK